MKTDVVLLLREIRRKRGLSQKDVAKMSGVGEKTISSFESGVRINTMKLVQLQRLLKVYNLTEVQFFSGSFIDGGGGQSELVPLITGTRLKCSCGRWIELAIDVV